MFTRAALTIALTVAMSLPAVPALAGPTDKAQGNAWAWGLYKKSARPAPTTVIEPIPAPAPEPVMAPVEDFEDVQVYAGPLNTSESGFWVKLYRAVQTSNLGYARPVTASGITEHYMGENPVFREYRITFDLDPANAAVSPGWNNAASRITYAYEGFTTVTLDGVSYPMGSPEAAAALATPGLQWNATYREMWCSNGYHTATSFNGWAVLNYSATR